MHCAENRGLIAVQNIYSAPGGGGGAGAGACVGALKEGKIAEI